MWKRKERKEVIQQYGRGLGTGSASVEQSPMNMEQSPVNIVEQSPQVINVDQSPPGRNILDQSQVKLCHVDVEVSSFGWC